MKPSESKKVTAEPAPGPKKRLFIGFPVELESSPTASLTAALKKTKIDAQRRDMEFQWTPIANFHVTLNFIGPTSPERIPDLARVITEVARDFPPLETSLRGMGAFPDDHHMRVLYIGVRKSRLLNHLQDLLREALVEAGFSQEERDYTPHLTVGRLRKSRSGSDLISPYVRTSFGDIDISKIVLFESLMQGNHVAYQPLATFDLTGTRAEPTDPESSDQKFFNS